MNLSAPFLCEVPPFFESMLSVMEFSELVFGNELESVAFAKAKGWKEEAEKKDLEAIAKKMASDVPFSGPGGHRGRTVVITHGEKPVVVVQGRGSEPETFPVPGLPEDKVVDTNGAGDAFVGGYLAQLALGADLETRVRCGVWAASVIIQRSGCTFPEKMEFKK